MATVRIYLKGWRDGELYANAVNRDAHPLHEYAMTVFHRSWREWEPGDVTYWAITYEAEGTDNEICNAAFERFNIGEDHIAATYRERGHRSLSVGDVVVIDERAYTVASPAGWKLVDFWPNVYAHYGWLVTRDYTVSCDQVEDPSIQKLTTPPTFKEVAVAGPHNIHPNVHMGLLNGEGQRFELFDDDGILYYRGVWFEDVATLNGIEPADLTTDFIEGNPLDDYGEPNAGATFMTVDANRTPYIG